MAEQGRRSAQHSHDNAPTERTVPHSTLQQMQVKPDKPYDALADIEQHLEQVMHAAMTLPNCEELGTFLERVAQTRSYIPTLRKAIDDMKEHEQALQSVKEDEDHAST